MTVAVLLALSSAAMAGSGSSDASNNGTAPQTKPWPGSSPTEGGSMKNPGGKPQTDAATSNGSGGSTVATPPTENSGSTGTTNAGSGADAAGMGGGMGNIGKRR